MLGSSQQEENLVHAGKNNVGIRTALKNEAEVDYLKSLTTKLMGYFSNRGISMIWQINYSASQMNHV